MDLDDLLRSLPAGKPERRRHDGNPEEESKETALAQLVQGLDSDPRCREGHAGGCPSREAAAH